MQTFNRAHIRQHFDHAAVSYDEAAVLQRQVADHLDERLDLIAIQPQVVLDVGAGTGILTQKMRARYPKAQVMAVDLALGMLKKAQHHYQQQRSFGQKAKSLFSSEQQHFINADAYALPLASGQVDLLVSNLMLQWCDDLDAVFQEFRRVLRPEGVLIFTTFGPDTLKELRQAWSKTDQKAHVNTFIDMHDIGDALIRNGFGQPVMDVEDFVLTYDKPIGVLKDLKAIGATLANQDRGAGLMGKQRFTQMLEHYEAFRAPRTDQKIPATYEVVHGHAWAAQEVIKGPNRDRSGLVEISLDQFKSGLKPI
ncbi:malonyl-ACP O-methyltransferase BioC [Thiosulfativibrio zosterae]|uniref:Malonyl-[acyl-carrier protein] O-methyltransferase n=1 Tax=Thiosulfativibrio zosterae TaxID=2675053 RepID=A0A6F8PK25_9GAMM|nr:malonyl-ACP O-methyltransferase BioC [Thiosulfativibrio zosterae]BBP42452.1 malonyl-[acyl-carrier protein] O-methyltransferase [Thiosulfativibrio zosterae]